MSMMSTSIGGILFIVMSGFPDASGVCSVYEFVSNEGTVIQPEKAGIAETLLDFKIEELAEHIQSSNCTAAQKLENDRRKLDPQLSASAGSTVPKSASQDMCKDTDFALPMNR